MTRPTAGYTVADGEGNHRAVVFDKDGKYVRQFGHPATKEQAAADAPGVFTRHTLRRVFEWRVEADPKSIGSRSRTIKFRNICTWACRKVWCGPWSARPVSRSPACGHHGAVAGQFGLHDMAVDSKGNLFIGEADGRRVQKFKAVGKD